MTVPPAATPDDATDFATEQHGGRALIMRIRFLCAMAVSATIFWYVGWWVAGPIDPDGPVSLLMLDQNVVAMAELLGLSVISSGLAVAICGAGSAGRGPLAIAVGLASLGLRGSQLDVLVLYRLNPPATSPVGMDPFPVWALIAECWLWLALIAVGFVVGRWVGSWFEPVNKASPRSSSAEEHSSDVRQGLGTIAITAVVAWIAITLAMGSGANPILKGQVYFSLGLAFLVGALVAHGFLRTDSRIWTLIAVAIVATVAYVFAGPDDAALAAAQQSGGYVNLRPIVRPLPIEYAALGAIGILIEDDAMRFFRALFGLEVRARCE